MARSSAACAAETKESATLSAFASQSCTHTHLTTQRTPVDTIYSTYTIYFTTQRTPADTVYSTCTIYFTTQRTPADTIYSTCTVYFTIQGTPAYTIYPTHTIHCLYYILYVYCIQYFTRHTCLAVCGSAMLTKHPTAARTVTKQGEASEGHGTRGSAAGWSGWA